MSNHSFPTSRLPTELTDQIIDHLHSDVHALRVCSLVCRGWVPSARYHLFHDVKLTGTTSTAFINLLRRSPHLSALVEVLNITQDEMHLYDVPIFLNSVLPLLAEKLTGLHTLRLSNLDFSHLRSETRNALLLRFSTIRSLSLTSVTFLRFRDFATFIVAHPHLHHLHLHHIWWASKNVLETVHVNSVLQQSFPLKLQSISLSDTSYHIVEWLTLQYPSLNIRSITHSTVLKCDIPALSNLFRCIGLSLHHLTISVQSMRDCIVDPACIVETALLLQNNNIRTLTLDNVLLLFSDTQVCAWIPAIISQLFSSYLEEIRLNLVWNALEQLRAVDMEGIDELLSHPRFGRLQKFTIQSNGYGEIQEGRRVMKGRMERLSKRNILRFE